MPKNTANKTVKTSKTAKTAKTAEVENKVTEQADQPKFTRKDLKDARAELRSLKEQGADEATIAEADARRKEISSYLRANAAPKRSRKEVNLNRLNRASQFVASVAAAIQGEVPSSVTELAERLAAATTEVEAMPEEAFQTVRKTASARKIDRISVGSIVELTSKGTERYGEFVTGKLAVAKVGERQIALVDDAGTRFVIPMTHIKIAAE